jgi:hypothetical protein
MTIIYNLLYSLPDSSVLMSFHTFHTFRIFVHCAFIYKSNWTRPVRRKRLPPGLVERKWVAPGADPGASNLDPTVVARGPAPRRSSRLTAHRPHFKPPTPTKETEDLLAGHAVRMNTRDWRQESIFMSSALPKKRAMAE